MEKDKEQKEEEEGNTVYRPLFLNIYLLVLLSGCGESAARRPPLVAAGGAILLCGGLALVASPVVEHRLGTWASVVAAHGLSNAASVVVAHGLSCSMARGIFLDQGSNLCLLHGQVGSLTLCRLGGPSPQRLFTLELSRLGGEGKGRRR